MRCLVTKVVATLMAVGVFALLGAGIAGAQEVSGAFESTKVVIKPEHVVAYPVRASWDPQTKGIAVLLSEAPVDVEAAVASLDPHTQAINQDALSTANYITINIWPSGTVAMNATISESMTQYIDNTEMQLQAEMTTNTPGQVAGRVYTKKAVELPSGETYEVDLTFSTAVTRPPAGKALGAEGGGPGKALQVLAAAVQARNWGAMSSGLPEDFLDRSYCDFEGEEPTDEEAVECALEDLPDWLTDAEQSIEIVGGVEREEDAVLEVVQEHSAGFKMLHLVQMAKTPFGWVLDRHTLVGML